MKPVTDATALVIDSGLFLPFAQHLSGDDGFKHVWYWSPCIRGFPTLNECIVGEGFDEVERVQDYWDVLKLADAVVFPDIQRSGLQLYLDGIGKPVFGSRDADRLEVDRGHFLRVLGELGLDVPKYTVVRGITKLRQVLRDKEDCYLKISFYRGSMETKHWRNWDQDEHVLDELAVKFGPAKDTIDFYVVDAIHTDIEDGSDQYCIDGKYPETVIHGVEAKDKAYIAFAQPFKELPEYLLEIYSVFAPMLRNASYRNFISSEVRVKGNKSFFIDPCMRLASPAGETMVKLFSNLPEIVWAGAHGELVQPELAADVAVECVLTSKSDKKSWSVLDLPAKAREWVMAGQSCEIDGKLCFPPDGSDDEEAGWLLGLGDTVDEAVDDLKKHLEWLGDAPVTCHTEALLDLVAEIREAEAEGITFTDGQVPKPAEVVEQLRG